MSRAAVLLLATLALAGCGGKKGLAPQQIIVQGATNTTALTSFHVVVDIENVPAPASGLNLTFVNGDVVVPDQLSARVGGSFKGLPLTSELIVIGADHYLKNPFSGAWTIVDVGLTPIEFFKPSRGVAAVIRNAKDVTSDGSEKVGDADCYRLRANVSSSALAPLVGMPPNGKMLPVELWIGKDDLVLRRIRVTGPIGPGEGADAVRTVELSLFGEHVTITAPKLAK